MFLFAGGLKLISPGQAMPMFVAYGYAAWFATFKGSSGVIGRGFVAIGAARYASGLQASSALLTADR
jgi:hypothetical protein